jgi:hypothetical protein
MPSDARKQIRSLADKYALYRCLSKIPDRFKNFSLKRPEF